MCLFPITVYRRRSGGSLIFNDMFINGMSKDEYEREYISFQIPCGKCVECVRTYSTRWQVRLLDELACHDKACFITLTYAVNPGCVSKSDFQKFMKRLRKRFGKVRFFACGEYGKKNNRPHYHAILFGVDFDDKKPFFRSENGDQVYRSATLERLWRLGFSTIGEVTPESCLYVAKYMQKLDRREHSVEPFTLQSRKPAIGLLNGVSASRLRTGSMTVRGHTVPLPRAYLEYARKYDGVDISAITEQRIYRASMRPRASVNELCVRRVNCLKYFGILRKNSKLQKKA